MQIPIQYIKLLGTIFFIATVITGCESQPVVDSTDTTTAEKKASIPLSLGDRATLDNAISLMRNEKWKAASKPLKKLKRKHPNNVVITVNLASSYFAEKQFDEAESLCKEALALDANSAEANNLFGLISVERKNFTAAESSYKKALSLNSEYANAHFNLALLYDMYFQEIPKAYQHYLKYLKLVPDDQNTIDWVEQLKYSIDQN